MHKLIYSKSEWQHQCYHFHFDVESNDETIKTMKGWFVNKSADNYLIQLVDQKGNAVKSITFLKNRPRLAALFPTIGDVENSGFEIDMTKLSPNEKYFIVVQKDENTLTKVISFVNKEPLLYVHIAKTAGSTVNKVLKGLFGFEQSLIHAESVPNWQELVKQQKVDFLSGHIPYKAFMQVSELQLYKKAITFREPYSHVISHLSWIRALALDENKERYEAHPEYIKDLSDKLASYDLSRSEQITEVIKTFNVLELCLLDNTQTRYIRTNLVKETVDESDVLSSLENLKSFDFVGADNNISGFLSDIASDYGFKYKTEDRRENVLSNKFGLDITDTAIKVALLPLVKYDLQLYDVVLRKSL